MKLFPSVHDFRRFFDPVLRAAKAGANKVLDREFKPMLTTGIDALVDRIVAEGAALSPAALRDRFEAELTRLYDRAAAAIDLPGVGPGVEEIVEAGARDMLVGKAMQAFDSKVRPEDLARPAEYVRRQAERLKAKIRGARF